MRILHVISGMNPTMGGVSQAVRTMCAGLAEEGVHNEIVDLDGPDAPFLINEPVVIHALGPARGPWEYGPRLLPWLTAHIDQFDVILLHGLWLYHGYALRKAMRICRKKSGNSPLPKWFIMPHGMLDPYFQQAPGRRLKAFRNWLYWQLIEHKVIADSDGMLFTCEAERQLAREPFRPYKPKSEAVVGLGVEEPPVYTTAMREAFLAKCPALRDTPYLLFLGRVNQKKGVDLLVKAYRQIAKKQLTADMALPHGKRINATNNIEETIPKLLIAGPGLDTPFGQTIQQMARTNEEPAILFSNMLSGDAKWGAFYGCEAFILPSHQENFGVAVVEALACGKPVLISDQVNIWQEIEKSGGGLVSPDSIEGIQNLLKRWLNLPANNKQKISHNALKIFQKEFAVASITRRLLSALH